MATAILSSENQVPGGGLSGGNWLAGASLANLKSNKLYRKARSASDSPEDTVIDLTFPELVDFRLILLASTNFTSAFIYRIRAYPNEDRVDGQEIYDTGPVEGGTRAAFGTLPFGSPYLYDGYTPIDDPERGNSLIHVAPHAVPSLFWRIEIDDEGNPAGYVEAGYLFMGKTLQPSVNFSPGSNGLSFVDNTLVTPMLNGAKDRKRRLSPRRVSVSFDYLTDEEIFGEIYRMKLASGYDRDVVIVLDPDATGLTLQRKTVLGFITEQDPLTQAAAGLAGTAFTIEENI